VFIVFDESTFLVNKKNQAVIAGEKPYPDRFYQSWDWHPIWLVALGLFILYLSINFVKIMHENNLLSSSDMVTTTTGTVTKKHVNKTKGGEIRGYILDYTYSINGENYNSNSPVNKKDYEQSIVGSEISITYVINEPSLSRPVNYDSFHYGTSIFYIITFLIGSSSTLISGLSKYAKNNYLRKNGKLVLGQLESVKIVQGRYSRTDIKVRFNPPNSVRTIIDTRTYDSVPNQNTELPKNGATIYIFYVDASNWEVL
jgi:hypothetical protein